MFEWLKHLFSGSRAPSGSEPESDEDFEVVWNDRMNALARILGPSEDMVYHAVVPLELGGTADVVEFRSFVDGYCYVTSDLASPSSSQRRNSLGNYELMICTREPADWAVDLISKLATYTLRKKLKPGETMDIGPALPEGSRAKALVFTEPEVESNSFEVLGKRAGILLCVTITKAELQRCFKGGSAPVIEALKKRNVFPFSDLNRNSVRAI